MVAQSVLLNKCQSNIKRQNKDVSMVKKQNVASGKTYSKHTGNKNQGRSVYVFKDSLPMPYSRNPMHIVSYAILLHIQLFFKVLAYRTFLDEI